MTRYTLHVPSRLNDGTPVGPETLDLIEGRLLNLAGGFTLTDAVGAWRDGETVYREPVRMYHADTDDDIRGQLLDLADSVRVALDQEAVYLTEQAIATTLVYATTRALPV